MTTEEDLSRLLRQAAEAYHPADGRDRVSLKVERRRRSRHRFGATAGVALVALAVTIAILASTNSDGAQRIRTANPAPRSTRARAEVTTTQPSESTPPATNRTSPSTTVLKNTVLRYWGPITAPYVNSNGLQLDVPPLGTTPKVTWQQAAMPCETTTGVDNCGAVTTPEDIFLAVATDKSSGSMGPNGSVVPFLDGTLVYVIGETYPCGPAVGGSPVPTLSTAPTTTTTATVPATCTSLQFVDATTGLGSIGMSGPEFSLPPHGKKP